MKKKNLSILLIAALSSSMMFSGCGKNEVKENSAGNDSESVSTAVNTEESTEKSSTVEQTVVTFETWNPADNGPDSPIHKIIAGFEAANPDIKIDYKYVDSGSYLTRIKVELMGGEGPDVFGMNAGSVYDEFRDFQTELTSYCEASWGSEWKNKFLDSCMKIIESDGQYYGLPLGQTYSGLMWADKNMLSSYGLEVPTSYDELLNASKVLRENNQMPLAIGAMDSWLNIDVWMSMAADVNAEKLYSAINGEIPFTDEALIESFKIWQDCFNDGIFQDGAIGMTLYNDVNDMFQKEGSIPLMLNGSWALNMYTLADTETQAVFNGEGADHELATIDWNNDGKTNPLAASVDVILCLNPDSEVKDAAFKFMDYMVNEGQELLVNDYLEYMPSRADMELNVQGLSEDGQGCLEVVLNNASNNVGGTRGIPYAELESIIVDMLDALATNACTPEEAAQEVQDISANIER